MKYSIKHLPKRTQEELNILLELTTRQIPGCVMVILFGSYARGGYVLWDEYETGGARYSYQSDLDLLVVVSKSNVRITEKRLAKKVTERYNERLKDRRHAVPQFIVEDINRLNKELEKGQYFFSDIKKEGIKIYDTGEYELAKPRSLSAQEIRNIAVEDFETYYPTAVSLLNGVIEHYYPKGDYLNSAFLLNQICEKLYNAISLVFTHYRPQCHKLDILAARVKECSRDLATVFPENTPIGATCYDLLKRAYIEARYNKHFNVTKAQLEYLITRVELLREITNRLCSEKIDEYNIRIENQKNSKP